MASPPASSLRKQGHWFAAFQTYYNTERPHEALGQTPSAEHYQASSRLYSGRLHEPNYADDWQVRRVRHSGEIKWRSRGTYISKSLVGETVGLAECEDGDWGIHFGPVRLGRIPIAGRFIRPKRRGRRPKPVRG